MGCRCCKEEKTLKDIIDEDMRICVWVLGGPGSGKGTLCKFLETGESESKTKFISLNFDDLLQKALNEDTPTAKKNIRAKMESRGAMHPDIVLYLFVKAMIDTIDNCYCYLIDGFPRDISQAELFTQELGTPHLILYLECPDDVLLSRLEQRGQPGDNPEAVKERLKTFHSNSQPILERWKDRVVTIDGTKCPELVVLEFLSAMLDIVKEIGIKKIEEAAAEARYQARMLPLILLRRH